MSKKIPLLLLAFILKITSLCAQDINKILQPAKKTNAVFILDLLAENDSLKLEIDHCNESDAETRSAFYQYKYAAEKKEAENKKVDAFLKKLDYYGLGVITLTDMEAGSADYFYSPTPEQYADSITLSIALPDNNSYFTDSTVQNAYIGIKRLLEKKVIAITSIHEEEPTISMSQAPQILEPSLRNQFQGQSPQAFAAGLLLKIYAYFSHSSCAGADYEVSKKGYQKMEKADVNPATINNLTIYRIKILDALKKACLLQ